MSGSGFPPGLNSSTYLAEFNPSFPVLINTHFVAGPTTNHTPRELIVQIQASCDDECAVICARFPICYSFNFDDSNKLCNFYDDNIVTEGTDAMDGEQFTRVRASKFGLNL